MLKDTPWPPDACQRHHRISSSTLLKPNTYWENVCLVRLAVIAYSTAAFVVDVRTQNEGFRRVDAVNLFGFLQYVFAVYQIIRARGLWYDGELEANLLKVPYAVRLCMFVLCDYNSPFTFIAYDFKTEFNYTRLYICNIMILCNTNCWSIKCDVPKIDRDILSKTKTMIVRMQDILR